LHLATWGDTCVVWLFHKSSTRLVYQK
jgi:hypothetical protein